MGEGGARSAEMSGRYAADGATVAGLARWLTGQGKPTRTGKSRWDPSVVWSMLRNPAYAGRAAFGKTRIVPGPPALNRVSRLPGPATPSPTKPVARPSETTNQRPVPANVP